MGEKQDGGRVDDNSVSLEVCGRHTCAFKCRRNRRTLALKQGLYSIIRQILGVSLENVKG